MKASHQSLMQPAARQGPATLLTRRGGAVVRATAANDRHERQADEAAVHVLRGEKGVARSLSPAPAAGFRPPPSGGEALPRLLREEMEPAFDADLSAVRVHRDAAAAAAARGF